MRRETIGLFGVLIVMGAGWGLTLPLAKIAVSEGYRQFGLIFWQFVIGAIILSVVQKVRDRRLRRDRPAVGIYLIIAFAGTIFPNAASFEAARHLPAGLISICLALVPMFAFPIALGLGNERFAYLRFLGLFCGLAGVALIVGPEASLPDRAMVVFVPLALIAPFFYGLEGNIVAKWGTAGLDPVEVLYGASICGAGVTFVLALATGQVIDPRPPWGMPDFAIATASIIHVTVYTAYVWLVGRAGAIFAVQVSYLVTGFGVFWSMILLGESFSNWVWSAMGVMLVGMFLVQPTRDRALPLAEETKTGDLQ